MTNRREFLAGIGASAAALWLPAAVQAWGRRKSRRCQTCGGCAACEGCTYGSCELACPQSYYGFVNNIYYYHSICCDGGTRINSCDTADLTANMPVYPCSVGDANPSWCTNIGSYRPIPRVCSCGVNTWCYANVPDPFIAKPDVCNNGLAQYLDAGHPDIVDKAGHHTPPHHSAQHQDISGNSRFIYLYHLQVSEVDPRTGQAVLCVASVGQEVPRNTMLGVHDRNAQVNQAPMGYCEWVTSKGVDYFVLLKK
jgi:hypothetical protein